MNSLSGVLLASIILLGPLAPTAGYADEAQTNPVAGDAAAIAEGEMLFEAVCAGYCHVKSGADRDGKCPNLFDCEWKNGEGTDAEMFKVVSDGVPKTEMVGFAGQLPDDMLWQILAYVRSASQCQADTAGPAPGPAPGTAPGKAAVSAHE